MATVSMRANEGGARTYGRFGVCDARGISVLYAVNR